MLRMWNSEGSVRLLTQVTRPGYHQPSTAPPSPRATDTPKEHVMDFSNCGLSVGWVSPSPSLYTLQRIYAIAAYSD
jgi:hypothetical protein